MSDTIQYAATRPSIDPAIRSFLATSWPEAQADPDTNSNYLAAARYSDPSGSYRLRIFHYTRSDDVVGVDLQSTVLEVDADYPDATGSVPLEVMLAANAHAQRVCDQLRAHLQSEVRVDWASVLVHQSPSQAPVVVVASAAAAALGDPSIFQRLAETGEWHGTIVRDNVGITLKLTVEGHLGVEAQALGVEALIHGEDRGRLGDRVPQEFLDRKVEHFYSAYESRLVQAAVKIQATAVLSVPRVFYETDIAVDELLTSLGGTNVWIEGRRCRVRAQPPDTRATIALAVQPTDSSGTASVQIAVERAARGFDSAETEQWQAAAESLAATLANAVEGLGTAPTFSIAAPLEAVRARLHHKLVAAFPSDTVQVADDGFRVFGFALGEGVNGSLNVAISPHGESETVVMFTGGLYGADLPGDVAGLARSRQTYRDLIVQMVIQMRAELTADLSSPPPSRPDIGLE